MSENGLPLGWGLTSLGDLGEYLNGRAFSKSEWSEEGRPIIRIQDLTGTGKSPNYYEGELEERYVVRPGDLLVSWSATLGAFIWRGTEGCLNQHIFKVQSFIDKSFHYYLVRSILDDLYRQAHGSGMVHITKGKFEATTVSLPPVLEQRRIVAAIDEQFALLDAGVAALKRTRANLKRYRASVLKAAVEGRLTERWREEHPDIEDAGTLLERILEERRARWEKDQLSKYAGKQQNPPKNWRAKYKDPASFDTEDLPELPEGWSWATVERIAAAEPNAITDGPFGSNLKTEHYRSKGARVLRLQNIGDGVFRDEEAFIEWERFEKLKKHEILAGDLAIAALGENPPRSCIVPEFVGPAIVKADCIRFKPSSHIRRVFASIVLNSEPTRKRTASSIHGVGRPRLNLGEIKSIVVPLPPLAEQEEIVAEVERRLSVVEGVEAQVEAGLKRAARLRQAILKRAFEGKLVPQDPNDEPAGALLERIREEREQSLVKKAGRKKPTKRNAKEEQTSLFSTEGG